MAALPLDTQRNIEADSFWCMSKLLDGIQVCVCIYMYVCVCVCLKIFKIKERLLILDPSKLLFYKKKNPTILSRLRLGSGLGFFREPVSTWV